MTKYFMKKKQGFAGQRTIELSPEMVAHFCANHPSANHGHFTKIGFFPTAKYQFIENESGSEAYILIYCIKGYGVAQINQTIYHISPGDFFIIPAHTPFSYQADELNPWSIFWFYFKGAAIQEMAELYIKSSHSYKGFLPYNEERIRLFNRIYQNLERGYGTENLTFMNMCLLNLISSFALVTHTSSPKQDKSQNVINSTVQFMKENSEGNLSLLQIADHVGISVSHFSFIFKSKTGVSPVNYYNTIKIQKGCEYLKFTDIMIKEIAFKLGILDAHYFSRLFAKTIGMSPNEYRKKHKLSDIK